MKRRFRLILPIIAIAILFGSIGWWAMPTVVSWMPSRYRYRLPQPILDRITTPVPTSLPPPEQAADREQLTIPLIDLAPGSPTAVVPPSSTPTPEDSPLPASVTEKPTAVPTPSPAPSPTPTSLPPSALIEGIKIVAQEFNNCGPANLSMLLRFHQIDINQLEIARVLRPNEDDRNVTPEELVRFVTENTPLQAASFRGGDLGLLKRLLVAGFPVVIEKGLIHDEVTGWMGHYLILIGYNDARQQFYGMDSFLGPWDSTGRAEAYGQFQEQWRHFNYAFYLVYPPGRSAEVEEILGPELLEPAAMWQRAALLAHAEINEDDRDPFAWFNLGSSLTRMGDVTGELDYYQNAVIAFDLAREIGLPARMLWYQFEPYVAYLAAGRLDDLFTLADATLAYEGGKGVEETFLYRGHALLASGNLSGARAAYQKALDLNPGYQLARDALSQLP